MIVTSMLLVIVGAVTLVVGIFTTQLQLVWISIGACLLAGVFLIVGVVRGRPSRKPVVTGGGEQASWSGATGSWPAGGDELARDEGERQPSGVAVVSGTREADDEAFQPSEEEIVVVPKRTAGSRGKKATKKTAKKASRKKATKKAAKKASRKKATKKTAGKKATKKTTKKATKKASRKKATKKTAKKIGGRAADARRLDEALSDVSGLGPAKRKALLDHFGSYDALRGASVRRLTEVNGVSETLARRIKRAL